MRIIILHIILLCFLLISCRSEKKDVLRETVEYKVITDSIFTRMPGTMIKTDDYLVWQDPFAIDGFAHIIDIKKDKEIAAIGVIGQGPDEFNTPSICTSSSKNSIFVYDMNTSHQAYYFIDSLKENKNPYYKYTDNPQNSITGIINIAENKFIISQPSKDKRFKIINNENITEFGNPLISMQLDNSYDVYQGAISYNYKRQKFVFTSLRLPYIEIYDIKNNIPTLVYKSDLGKESYSIEGKTLKPYSHRKGARDLTLLKDFIVVIQRDYDIDNIDESTVGMDFNKLPKTVFLYDYNGGLKKIVDVGIPIFRIAGNVKDNILYAIGVNPDFVIVKCEL
ncbi:BF3164 family lipoprotein [Petrimonas sp.]|uniref:BF3164 family lipoprotein n=1 Tax=Petrimonas sp. TaxID=2023866 RepID=UPI003F50EEC2